VAPSNLRRPTIRGLARVGETLTGTTGRWSGRPAPTLELQWLRCDRGGGCSAVAGATKDEYAPSRSDLGAAFVLQVTATNTAGDQTVVSRPSKPVEAAPLNLEPPSISGTATVGQTLTAKPGSWSAFPSPDFDYQWLRCDRVGQGCTAIPGATAETLLLTANDAGFTLRVDVTASNALGTETAGSDASPVVKNAPVAPVNVRPPVVKYSLASGSLTFTASPGIWRGSPKPTYTYQWQDCSGRTALGCVDIKGERSRTYTPGDRQPDCQIRVIVTARNEAGTGTAKSARVINCID